jgi:hypothetical protein
MSANASDFLKGLLLNLWMKNHGKNKTGQCGGGLSSRSEASPREIKLASGSLSQCRLLTTQGSDFKHIKGFLTAHNCSPHRLNLFNQLTIQV